MQIWLYTLRERVTSDMKDRFHGYRDFSGFAHITELVTLDSMMCPDVITDLRDEDWQYNLHEDFRTELFRDADYLLGRQPLDRSRHHLVAAFEDPEANSDPPPGSVRRNTSAALAATTLSATVPSSSTASGTYGILN